MSLVAALLASALVSANAASPGTVVAWGWNDYGQTTAPAGLSGVAAVAAGYAHTVALKSNGTVLAWGYNGLGEATVPTGLSGVTAIAAGSQHTVALKGDGTVVAWGRNDYGQTTAPAGLSGVAAVAAGSLHTVALKGDGTVVAWGYNGLGEATVPTGLSGVTAIAAGGQHTVALKSDGTVVAWGLNTDGQTTVPAGLSGVTAVAAGRSHTVALKGDGTVVAWGRSFGGETTLPLGLSGVAAIAAGGGHTVALKGDGTVVAWGYNDYGQRTVPLGLSGVTAVAAGVFHTVALGNTVTPSGVTATVPTATTNIQVNWTAVSGAATYNVYMANSSGVSKTNYLTLGGHRHTGITGTSFTHPSAAAGSVWYIVVTALNAFGESVESSPEVIVTVPNDQTLTVTKAGTGSGTVTSSPAGISCGSSCSAAYTFGTTLTLTATPDSSSAFVGWSGGAACTGVAACTVTMDTAKSVTATFVRETTAPSVPIGLTVRAVRASQLNLSWSASTDNVGVTGYKVYRGDVLVGSPSGTSYTNTGLTASTLYSYTVAACDAAANCSALSAPVSATTIAASPPGTVVAWGDNSSGQTTVPAGLSGVTAVAAGSYHTVALKSDGTVVAWGNNGHGQTTVPAGLSGVTAVAAGQYHTVALKSDGTVVAWGYNDSGQTTVPLGLSGVTAVAAGSNHTVALKSDGTVVAWGNNSYGQTTVPAGLSGVTAVAVEYYLTVALKSDGTVVAWGYYYGQTAVPAGLSGVTAVAAGEQHTVALKSDGTVVAWGNNGEGRTLVPAGLSGVTAVAAGLYHTVALKSDGTVVAWGSGNYQVPAGLSGVTAIAAGGSHTVALGNTVTPSGVTATVPTATTNIQINWTAVSGATSYNVYMANSSGVSKTNYSTLGGHRHTSITGTSFTHPSAAAGSSWYIVVTALNALGESVESSPEVIVTVPYNQTLTVTKAGTGSGTVTSSPAGISCGSSCSAAYAFGTTLTLTATPDSSSAFVGWSGGACTGVAACTVTMDAAKSVTATLFRDTTAPSVPIGLTVRVVSASQLNLTWSASTDNVGVTGYKVYRGGALVGSPTGASYINTGLTASTSYSYTVAACDAAANCSALSAPVSATTNTASSGTVVAWGSNSYGQTSVPVGLSGVTVIAAGNRHTVALKGDGTVLAWGWNGDGQTTVPVGLSGVTAVAAGAYHTVALKSDGTVLAWGFNGSGQTTVPAGLSGVTAVAAGEYHTVAMKSDGTVLAWGFNGSGQTTVPSGLSGVTAVAAGNSHTVVLKSDGTVLAWGDNSVGQTTVPAGLSGVAAVAAGGSHTVALKGDGTMVAWGLNESGQTTVPIGLSGVTAVAAGSSHTVALKSDGTVVAWGNNSDGQTTVPVGLSGVTAIAAGGSHTVAPGNTVTPAAPGGVTPTVPTATTNIQINWTAVSSAATYNVYMANSSGVSKANYLTLGGHRHTGITGTSFTHPSAAVGSAWYIVVTALNAAGESVVSSQVNLTIAYAADTQAPTVPAGLATTPTSSSQVNLSWSASTDNVGVTGYKVYRGGALVGSPTGTSYINTGLTASTLYSYTVAACDAAANCSALSAAVSATTHAATVTALNFVASWNLVGNSVNAPLTVATTFADATNVSTVWKWVPATNKWAFYTPTLTDGGAAYAANKGYDFLTTVNGGEGFWVNAKAPFTASLPTGAALTASSFQDHFDPAQNKLRTGWNLIATGDSVTPSAFNIKLSATPPAQGPIPVNVTTLWAWDNTQSKWYFYAPSLEASGGLAGYLSSKGYLDFATLPGTPTGTLSPTTGFWVNKP